MRARVVSVEIQPGKTEEASRIVQQSIVPAMAEQKGFRGQLFLTQQDTGKSISINLWETEADLKAFEGSPVCQELLGCIWSVVPTTSSGFTRASDCQLPKDWATSGASGRQPWPPA